MENFGFYITPAGNVEYFNDLLFRILNDDIGL